LEEHSSSEDRLDCKLLSTPIVLSELPLGNFFICWKPEDLVVCITIEPQGIPRKPLDKKNTTLTIGLLII
jgi:hypothetical protein